MKIFQTIQMRYATLGIRPTNPSDRTYPFDLRIFLGFLPLGYTCVSQIVIIFHVANGFTEYIENICTLFTYIRALVFFVPILCKRTKLFEIIENMEKFIDASKKILNIRPIYD